MRVERVHRHLRIQRPHHEQVLGLLRDVQRRDLVLCQIRPVVHHAPLPRVHVRHAAPAPRHREAVLAGGVAGHGVERSELIRDGRHAARLGVRAHVVHRKVGLFRQGDAGLVGLRGDAGEGVLVGGNGGEGLQGGEVEDVQRLVKVRCDARGFSGGVEKCAARRAGF